MRPWSYRYKIKNKKFRIYLERQTNNIYRLLTKSVGQKWKYYVIARKTDILTLTDTWTLYGHGYCDFNGEKVSGEMAVVVPGVWDYALVETGYTWIGNNHGNDELYYFNFFANGKPVSLNVGEIKEVSNFQFQQKSNLYLHSDNTTPCGDVYRRYIFDNNGVTLVNKIDWIKQAQVSLAYVAMCPVGRGSEISTKAKYIEDEVIQDISSEGFPLRNRDEYGAMYWNDTNGISVKVEIENPVESLNNYNNNGTSKTFIQNTSLYNKFYATRVDGDTVVNAGDGWNTIFRFESYIPETL